MIIVKHTSKQHIKQEENKNKQITKLKKTVKEAL